MAAFSSRCVKDHAGFFLKDGRFATANPSNDRALPQIGRDAVKFSLLDGRLYSFVVRGTLALSAKQGLKADEHSAYGKN
ncbi:MAG: hypothetical protein ACM3OF_05400 [Gemmatimonas sp.]